MGSQETNLSDIVPNDRVVDQRPLPSLRVTAMAPPSLRTFLDLLRLFHRYQYTAEAELANGAVIHLLDLNAVSGTDRHTVHRTNLRLGRLQQQTHGRNFLSSPLTRHE